jgi:NAD(P)-dependent dehydrogenase (short-subunit alcohol dehydrogenase family)
MKIVIVGATGTIGRKVTAALVQQHEVIQVGYTGGDLQVDIASRTSIERLFSQTGRFDALISIAGNAKLGPLEQLAEADFRVGLEHKLLGQINLVLAALPYINHGGSFTLTSGILAEDPIREGAACTTTDAAVNGFVTAAAVDLTRDLRINAVAPGVVEDSPALHPFFPGHIPVAMDKVVAAYLKAVLGPGTGRVIRAY